MQSDDVEPKKGVLEIGVDEASLVELFEALRNVEGRIAEKRRLDREREQEEDEGSPEVREIKRVLLGSFQGVAGLLVSKFHGAVQYAVFSSFKRPYGDFKQGILLRLVDSFKPADLNRSREIAPGVSLSSSYDWCSVSFGFFDKSSRDVAFLEFEERMYIELAADEYSRLATLSYIAVSLNVLQPIYDGLAMYISSILPFDPGEIVLAGYDDIVEQCGRLLRSDDPRLMNRHILLAGPPGCGKSMIAKRVAANHPEFVRCNLTRVDDWLYWVSMLAKILDKCERRVLLIIDEIDELGMSRRSGRKGVYELLRLMDGVEDSMNISILATTNRLGDLDEALLRPGRFGPVMHVDVPDREQVRAILEYYRMRYRAIIDVERVLGEMEEGFSGAEIRIAIEDCIVHGSEVTTEGVIENLRGLRESREKMPGKKRYYTKKNPSGPWSRALYEKRTGKLFKEEEFRDDHKDK
jgi:hypothetical protein